MMVDEDGQPAVTLYKVLDYMGRSVSLIALRPKTGRTHQLRVHWVLAVLLWGMANTAERRPLNDAVSRLCLHATAIEMADGSFVTAPIPDDMRRVFNFFGLDADKAFRQASNPTGFED